MHRNGGWFAIFVPVAKLLPPQLLREDLFSALNALGDFRLRSRQHLIVAESLHVAYLETVDEHPIEAREVIGAPFERCGMGFLEVARHRAREMHGVLLPRSWPWRVEAESGRVVGRSHGDSCLGRPAARQGSPLAITPASKKTNPTLPGRILGTARRLASCWFPVKLGQPAILPALRLSATGVEPLDRPGLFVRGKMRHLFYLSKAASFLGMGWRLCHPKASAYCHATAC